MEIATIVILFLVGISGISASENSVADANESFRYFLQEAMKDFPGWVSEQDLDPTPPSAEVGNVKMNISENQLVSLEGTLWDVSMSGLSKENPIIIVSSTSFISGNLEIVLELSGGGLQGIYNASGMVLGKYPISGQGYWNMTSGPFYLEYRNEFFIQNDYIKLNNTQSNLTTEFKFNRDNKTGSFEDLFTPDTVPHKDLILDLIVDQINQGFGYAPRKYLAHKYIFNYLDSIFSKTPLADVIAPISTTTIPTSTTSRTTNSTTTTTTTIPTDPFTTTNPPPSGCPKQEISPQSEGMNNFLEIGFNNFGEWLEDNKLDPTPTIIPPVSLSVNTSFLTLDGTFRNTVGKGISNRLSNLCVFSNILTAQFSIEFSLSNVTIYGQYNANGTIISLYPIEGIGNWSIDYNSMEFRLNISGFAIQDGYINIKEFNSQEISIRSDDSKITMDDLLTPDDAEGLGKEVLIGLKDLIPQTLQDNDKHPVVKSVLDYLGFLFSKTPLTDIIGTTRRPFYTKV